MTTRDKIATGSITYKTIGWTIKRHNAGIFEPWNECAYISLTSLGRITDPEDPRYCYSTFYCDKETIYNAIGKVSSDWQETLYRNGGTVYLDAIMTVCHNGIPSGALTDNPPAYTGQVYFYYNDIVNAQNWANPESLLSHFNKSLNFPANPVLLKETSYEIHHMELTADNRALPLSRYKKDATGTLRNWETYTFPYYDFSSHYFVFDHSSVRVTYYDGLYDDLSYAAATGVTVSNPTGLIAHISITYYYRRVNAEDCLEHRYLLSEDGELATKGTVCATSSQSNVEAAADNYNVLQGIPGGSCLDLTAILSSYAYRARFLHCYGEFTCSIPIRTTYRLIWSDSSGNHDETVTLNETYYVDRKYSFYRLSDYAIYVLSDATFFQNALEMAYQSVFANSPVSCDIQKDTIIQNHYTLPVASPLTLYGGILTGNGSRPSLPVNTMQAKAEESIGAIQVKNDRLQIGEDLLLSNDTVNSEGAAPVTPSEETFTTLKKTDCLIPEMQKNSSQYTTACFAYYKNIASKESLSKTFSGNKVVVHTPVICDTKVSDDKKRNQQVTPVKNRASLVLGCSFTLRTTCEGFHSSLPGYGKRNYSQYVKEIQVSFPFPVYLGDTLLEENLWHAISSEESLSLPTGVSEGNYEIKLRVLAKNTPEETDEQKLAILCQEGANTDRACTIATRSLPVCVTGRLYGFSFQLDKTNYQVGIRNENGILNGNSLSRSFPVTGCLFYTRLPFLLKTIGTPPSDTDYLELCPSFYHVDEKGQNRQPVDLYLLKSDDKLEKYAPKIKLSLKSVSYMGEETGNVPDSRKSLRSVQYWSGSFHLPEPLLVVPSGRSFTDELEEKGSLLLKDSNFLQDGFLLVNFSITYKRRTLPSLSYINSMNAGNGYCNMWKTEGFPYSRMDKNGNNWSFTNGDTLLFSLKKGYKVYTTH